MLLTLLPIAAALGSAACARKSFTCNESTGLTPEQLQRRAEFLYTDRAPKAELMCDRCTQYVAPNEEGCGTCSVIPGPTHPQGYCKLFQAKQG